MKRPFPVAITTALVVISLAVVGVVLASSDTQSNGRGGTVATDSSPLGTILVDRSGRTLYQFEKDTPGESACSAACAMEWPPLIASGQPMAAGEARGSLLGTTRRADGRRQVTYSGRPLYRYVGDTQPGQTNGQGLRAFGARWSALSPTGKRAGLDDGNQAAQQRYGSQSPPRPSVSGY